MEKGVWGFSINFISITPRDSFRNRICEDISNGPAGIP